MILHELISYDVLRVIWWLLLGILLVGFAVTDGFDLGAAALLRITGKTDVERRVVISTIGPVWEGNQVWLILGGGAIFAAWPMLYAISFSGFYLAMFAVLVCLIIRPVAFKFRSKQASTAWRNTWDWLLTLSGWGAALVFGVAMGNVLLGVPFRLSDDMRIFWDGSFFDLFTPFALLCCLAGFQDRRCSAGPRYPLGCDGRRVDHRAVCGGRLVAGQAQRLCADRSHEHHRPFQPHAQVCCRR